MSFDLRSLGDEAFERLCCDLLAQESGGLIADLYGRSGQRQFGIDVIGIIPGSGEVIALECKCVTRVTGSIIERAVGRFWRHRTHWVAQGVARFILCLASDIDDVASSDLILSWLHRLRGVGIQFEVWSATTICRKLSSANVQVSMGHTSDSNEPPRSGMLADQIAERLKHSSFSSLGHFVTKEPQSAIVLTEIAAALPRHSLGASRISEIRFADRLLGQDRIMADWRIRRLIGRALGDTLSGSDVSRMERKQIDALSEAASTDSRAQLIIAIAASARPGTARQFSNSALVRLLMSRHPQVRWQLAKRWTQMEPFFTAAVDTDTMFVHSDDWVRRRFVLTYSQRDARRPRDLLRLVRRTQEIENGRPHGTSFFEALSAWLREYRAIPSDTPSRHARFGVARRLERLMSANYYEPAEIRRVLDVACITLDYQLSRSEGLIGETSRGEGRYSVIRQWVHNVITHSSSTQAALRALSLTDAGDEGIRWAVAFELRGSLSEIASDTRFELLMRLLSDEHPWVLREALTSLSKSEASLTGDLAAILFPMAANAIQTAHASGWDFEELTAPYLKLAALFPRLLRDRASTLLEMFQLPPH